MSKIDDTQNSRIRCGDVNYELDAYIWLRDKEWVLEISGTINDSWFAVRHSEPTSRAPEDVAGLPTLYELAEDRIDNPLPVGYLVDCENEPDSVRFVPFTEADEASATAHAAVYRHPPSNELKRLQEGINEALNRESSAIMGEIEAVERATNAEQKVAELEKELAELRGEKAHMAEIASKAIVFRLFDDVLIESRGMNLWAVTTGGRSVLNNMGEFEFEPMPSSRSDEFIARTRFSFSDAWVRATNLIQQNMKPNLSESV